MPEKIGFGVAGGTGNVYILKELIGKDGDENDNK